MRRQVDRFLAFSRTREGLAVNGLALLLVLFTLAALAASRTGSRASGIGAFIIALPLSWGAARLLVALARGRWEANTRPASPPFARQRPAGPGGATLRRDNNAEFWHDRGGFLWRRRYWFVGTGCPPTEFTTGEFMNLSARHRSVRNRLPVAVVQVGDRQWWWYEDTFYWDSGSYSAADIKALLYQRARRKQRELDHAHTMLDLEESGKVVPRKREPISEDVKRAVFRRDEGRCQQCGSTELLQFDHVIPFSMGGSNEPQNLQLLCARCNREKGGVL